jgi:hypothetical protein
MSSMSGLGLGMMSIVESKDLEGYSNLHLPFLYKGTFACFFFNFPYQLLIVKNSTVLNLDPGNIESD